MTGVPVAADETGQKTRRIMLVDDHPIVRRGLRRLIEGEADLEVCGEAASVREARQAIREGAPDAVVADISLRDGDGIELVTDLHAHHPELPVLVLSMHDETIYAERLLAAGARGYIMKQAAGAEFLVALRSVLGGGVWVSDTVRSRILARCAADDRSGPGDPIDRLSNRELQVLGMIGRGLSSRQMADALSLSVKTVESHRQRIKSKLGLSTSAQLVRFASVWVAGRAPPAAGSGPP